MRHEDDAAVTAVAPQPAARRCAGCTRRRRALRAWWRARPFVAPALATALVAGVVGLLVLRAGSGGDAAPALLAASAASGGVVVSDLHPQQRRDTLATALASLGASVRRYERLGRHGLQARFTPPLAPATQAALVQLGVVADAVGVVQVEVEALLR